MRPHGEPIDVLDLVDANRWGRRGYPFEQWARLRASEPVKWCEPEGFRPFWALTKYEDVRMVSVDPARFSSEPRNMLIPVTEERRLEQAFPGSASRGGFPLRTLVNMDPPEHRTHRGIAAPYFLTRYLQGLEDRLVSITDLLLDDLVGERSFDAVVGLAAWHPLRMICEIIGVGLEHEDLILSVTRQAFGSSDQPSCAGTLAEVIGPMMQLFGDVVERRRREPRPDLATVLATATIEGEPLAELDMLAYFLLIATAGHDTTRNAIAGGLRALAERPDQLDLLRQAPELAGVAADEIVRWTSPVVHFVRTPVEDVEIRGQHIRAGDSLVLFYPSANRDEDIFEEPDRFRVDRDPNPHVGFGFGEHFCLGARLARMELRVLLERLVPRLEALELDGDPTPSPSVFVSGLVHLPVKWALRPAPG
jgi:cytochrome P450